MNTLPASPEILAVFERVFPISSGSISLELPRGGDGPITTLDDALHVVARIFFWDDTGPTRSIIEIKQQEVLVCDQRVHDLTERLEAGLQAHARALRVVFEDRPEEIAALMPSDLFFPEIFRLKTARTVEDFTRALAVKSRLDVPSLRGDS